MTNRSNVRRSNRMSGLRFRDSGLLNMGISFYLGKPRKVVDNVSRNGPVKITKAAQPKNRAVSHLLHGGSGVGQAKRVESHD